MSSQGYTLFELLKTTLAAAVAVIAATVVCAKPKKTVTHPRDVSRAKSKSSESVTPGGSSSASKSKGDNDTPKESAPKTQKHVVKPSAEKTALPKQEISKKNLELVTCEDQVILSVIQPPPVDLSQVPQEVRERLNITRTQEKEDDDKDALLPLVRTQDITPSMEIEMKGSTLQEQQKVTQQEPQKVTQQEQPKVTQPEPQKVIQQEPQKVMIATNENQPAVITVNKVAPPVQHHIYKPTTYVTAIAGRAGPQILQGPVPPPQSPEPAAVQPTPMATEQRKVAPPQPTTPSATQTTAPTPQSAPTSMKHLPISTAPRGSVPVAPSAQVGSKPGGPGAAQPQMATKPGVPVAQPQMLTRTKPGGFGGAQPQMLAKPGVSEAAQNQMVTKPGAPGSAQPQMLMKPGALGAVQPQMSTKPGFVNKYTTSPRSPAVSYVAKAAGANVQAMPASTGLREQNKMPPIAVGNPATTGTGVKVNQVGASKQPAAPHQPAPSSFPTTTPAPQIKEPLLEPTEPPKPTQIQPSLSNKTVGKPTLANQPGIQPSLTNKPPSAAQPPGMPKPFTS